MRADPQRSPPRLTRSQTRRRLAGKRTDATYRRRVAHAKALVEIELLVLRCSFTGPVREEERGLSRLLDALAEAEVAA